MRNMHALDSTRLVPVQIISGDEQRTTLMLKNVPIRLQIHELAHLVEGTSGKAILLPYELYLSHVRIIQRIYA